jgi:uncharacterized protein YggE
MTFSRRLLPAALALGACGGQPAGAQVPTPADEDDLAHAYLYEVAPEQVAPQQDAGFVEVSGAAVVMVAPDRARARFAVESQGATAGEASTANANVMTAVTTALEGSGIPGLKVETFGYSLRPEYSYPSGQDRRTRTIGGYTALNNVRVTVDDVEAVGRVVDLAVQAGANRVSSLAFEAANTEAARREALTLAVERARAEARVMAAALGRELGPALEVRGGAQAPTPIRAQAMAMRGVMEMEAAAETPIEAGDQSVRATVTIRFALGPGGETR